MDDKTQLKKSCLLKLKRSNLLALGSKQVDALLSKKGQVVSEASRCLRRHRSSCVLPASQGKKKARQVVTPIGVGRCLFCLAYLTVLPCLLK